jgi:hypothetical protein
MRGADEGAYHHQSWTKINRPQASRSRDRVSPDLDRTAGAGQGPRVRSVRDPGDRRARDARSCGRLRRIGAPRGCTDDHEPVFAVTAVVAASIGATRRIRIARGERAGRRLLRAKMRPGSGAGGGACSPVSSWVRLARVRVFRSAVPSGRYRSLISARSLSGAQQAVCLHLARHGAGAASSWATSSSSVYAAGERRRGHRKVAL